MYLYAFIMYFIDVCLCKYMHKYIQVNWGQKEINAINATVV